MITVISQHLSLVHNGLVSREQLLRNIHYVETLRYNITTFEVLRKREIDVPPNFNPGISVSDEELRHLYRFMVLWFTIEGVVRTCRSFLDFFWRTVATQSPELSMIREVRNEKYMSKGLSILRKKASESNDSLTYHVLEEEWILWGRYVVNFRNYIDYKEPLGGILSHTVGRIIQNLGSVDILLPDSFPGFNERSEPFQFTYEQEVLVSGFFELMIGRIDLMLPAIVNEIHH